jgi:hypothetical protein
MEGRVGETGRAAPAAARSDSVARPVALSSFFPEELQKKLFAFFTNETGNLPCEKPSGLLLGLIMMSH